MFSRKECSISNNPSQNAVCFKRIFDVYASNVDEDNVKHVETIGVGVSDEYFLDHEGLRRMMSAFNFELSAWQCKFCIEDIVGASTTKISVHAY